MEKFGGGVLIKPVLKLLSGISDGVIEVLQKNINGQTPSLIKIEGKDDWWSRWGAKVLGIVIGIVVVAGLIALAIVTGGASLAATALGIGAVIKISAVGVIVGASAGYIIADNLDGTYFPEDIYLPMFSISAEEIFSNEIYLFDINFFKKDKIWEVERPVTRTETINPEENWKVLTDSGSGDYEQESDYKDLQSSILSSCGTIGATTPLYMVVQTHPQGLKKVFDYINSEYGGIIIPYTEEDTGWNISGYFTLPETPPPTTLSGDENIHKFTGLVDIKDKEGTVVFTIECELINYRNESDGTSRWEETIRIHKRLTGTVQIEESQTVQVNSTAQELSGIISAWYFILRNLAILVLMLVLIYSGIRIVIGSTAGEKAKYKERITDWLVAMCLLFIMHYIMVFSVELVEKITELVKEFSSNAKLEMITLTSKQETNLSKNYPELYNQYVSDGINDKGESVKRLMWQTNLIGAVKIQSQLELMGTAEWAGNALAYVVLVAFTLFFAWTYLKRVLYLAFLTMIAPLVAMTYPIDKITDGKAQAFNMWLREYIFNLMIQPMHLLLYTMLITSAYDLAAQNVIYTLVAVGFMMPAEKLIRKFFGFEKAHTPGLLGGAAGAALAMSGLQKLTGRGKGGKHNSGGNSDKGHNSDKGPRFSKNEAENKPYDTLLGDSAQEGGKGEDIKFANNESDDEQPGTTPFSPGGGSGGGSQDGGQGPKNPQKVNVTRKNVTSEEAARLMGEQEGRNLNANQRAKEAAIRQESAEEEAKKREKEELAKRQAASKKADEEARRAKENRPIRRIGRTILGASKAYARGLGNKALKRMKNGRPIRAMLRGATGLFGGALLGATGLALGIASGDASKTLQYTGAGTLGGYSLGKSVAGSVADTLSVNPADMEEEVERSWYGEDYAEHKYEQIEEENLMSESNIAYYRDVTGESREEAKEFLDTTGREYYRHKVTDVGDMLAIERSVNQESQDASERISRDEAIAATRLKKSFSGNIKDMSAKKEKEYRETYEAVYQEKLKKRYPNWKDNPELLNRIESISREKADKTIRIMKTLESNKSNLTTL